MSARERNFWQAESLASRLEAGELIHFPACPFTLPDAADLDLFRRLPESQSDIVYDPLDSRLEGLRSRTADAERFAEILRQFSVRASGWLANELPEYASHWQRDRATFRPEEEATRLLPLHSRNDLLHVDNFPHRPTAGRRLLRLFVNVNAEEPRVWATSVGFAELLERFQRRSRVPSLTEAEWCHPPRGLQRLLMRDMSGRTAYDTCLQKVQQMMRTDDEFQEHSPKRLWSFAPGACWLLFADGLSHATLRGQFALEHSFFVPQYALVRPDLSPLSQLVAAGRGGRLLKAG